MKKIAATLLVCVITTVTYALPIGNPWEASLMHEGVFCEGHYADYCDPCTTSFDAWSLRFGYYGDFVWDRNMEIDRNEDNAKIRNTAIWTNSAYFALNFWDCVDLFWTLGTTSVDLRATGNVFTPDSLILPRDIYLLTETDFSWSVGLRGTLWRCGCLELGGEFEYFKTNPNINRIFLQNNDTLYLNDGITFKYKEWQFGFAAAYRVNIIDCSTAIIPYFGIKWCGVHVDMDEARVTFPNLGETITLHDLQNEWDFGYAFGLTLLGCNKTSVTAEVRLRDEKALYVNGQFRF